MAETYQWFAGIDWASKEHAACVTDNEGKVLGERTFAHDGAGLAALVSWLLDKTKSTPRNIAVAIEVPHGAVVETLLDSGMDVFSLNPKQSDRFRDRFSLAGMKDDRFDARVIASAVRTDRAHLRHLKPSPDEVIQLREWSRIHDEIGTQRSGLISRFDAQLLRYYPAYRQLCHGVIGTPWTLALWELAPSPKAAKRHSPQEFAALLKESHVRKLTGPQARRALTTTPLKVSPATVDAAVSHIRILVSQLKLLNTQFKQAEAELSRCLENISSSVDAESPGNDGEHHDGEILLSLPGVGRIVAAVMLAEASLALKERDYDALRSHCGVAPVTRASCGSRRVLMRRACSVRLRNAVYHWARVSIQRDELCRAKYSALRARGKSHGRALRTAADRLLAVLCAMLRSHTTFDPSASNARAQKTSKMAA